MGIFNHGTKTDLHWNINYLTTSCLESDFLGVTKASPMSIVKSDAQTQIELLSPKSKIPQNIPDNVTKYPT